MASKGKGQNCNRGELAEFFGVAPPTVDSWVRAGCPVVQKGQRGVAAVFNTADVADWRTMKAREEGQGKSLADESELKRRKLAAEAEKVELEVAKAKGEVAPINEFRMAQSKRMAVIRQNVMNVPARVVTQLLGCTDELEFKQKLRAELALALETAAQADIEIDNIDEETDAD